MSKIICFLVAVVIVLSSFISVHLILIGDRFDIILGTGLFGAIVGLLMSMVSQAWDI